MALAIDEGHISTKKMVPSITTTLTPSSLEIINGNDVAGVVKVNTGGAYTLSTTKTEKITVSYVKSYNTGNIPVVLVTPCFPMPTGVSYWIEATDISTFSIYLSNNSVGSLVLPTDKPIFTYMVMGLHN
jgi:hypothetical protein